MNITYIHRKKILIFVREKLKAQYKTSAFKTSSKSRFCRINKNVLLKSTAAGKRNHVKEQIKKMLRRCYCEPA